MREREKVLYYTNFYIECAEIHATFIITETELTQITGAPFSLFFAAFTQISSSYGYFIQSRAFFLFFQLLHLA